MNDPLPVEGIWAALPTPFDENGHLDLGVLRENVRRHAAAGTDGVYITDADGEFYAIELDEFGLLVHTLAEEAASAGIAAQAGISWSSTAGILHRLRIAADAGLSGAHVGHPIYMPMTRDSWLGFWDDIVGATPADFALVHYNTPKMPNLLGGADYRELYLRTRRPDAVKWVGSDVTAFARLVRAAPHVQPVVGDQSYGAFAPHGATGVFSWFANVNPAWMLALRDAARSRDWEEVFRLQGRLLDLIDASDELVEGGNEHAVLAKAMCAASPFLLVPPTTRAPYLRLAPDRVERWRRRCAEEFPDLVPSRRDASAP